MADAFPPDAQRTSSQYETPTARATPVPSHEINWLGISGAIVWISIASFFFIALGYATTGWYTVDFGSGRNESGLWEKCHCTREPNDNDQDFVRVTQAFITMSLILLFFALAGSLVYNLLEVIPRTPVLITLLVIFSVSVFFILVGIAVYGSESKKTFTGGLSYSYAFVVISFFLSIGGIVFTIMQMVYSGISVAGMDLFKK